MGNYMLTSSTIQVHCRDNSPQVTPPPACSLGWLFGLYCIFLYLQRPLKKKNYLFAWLARSWSWHTGSSLHLQALSLRLRNALVVVHGFSRCSRRLSCSWRILTRQPGVKPMSPALRGGVLTTGPPGKSPRCLFWAVFPTRWKGKLKKRKRRLRPGPGHWPLRLWGPASFPGSSTSQPNPGPWRSGVPRPSNSAGRRLPPSCYPTKEFCVSRLATLPLVAALLSIASCSQQIQMLGCGQWSWDPDLASPPSVPRHGLEQTSDQYPE